LIDLARKKPGELSYAVTGVGRLTHLTGELLQLRTGIKLQLVPYSANSAQAISDDHGGAPPLVPWLAPAMSTAWRGWVVTSLALPAYHLAEADERSTPSEPRKEPWNWKVRYENSNDGYHANRLHAGPVHNCVPSALARFPELPPDIAGYFRYNGTTHQDCSFNPTLRATLPIFPDLTIEERNRFLFMCVPPTLTFNCSSDIVNFNLFAIDGPCEMSSRRGFLVAPGAMRQPLFEERLNTIVATNTSIVEQDRHVDKLVQIGLQSKFAIRGRYSWQEQSQRELNCWIVQRYQATWKRLRPRGA